jgi:tetratricopeptide repeat protein 21B
MFGIAKCRETMSAYTQALDTVNRILVSNSSYKCAIVEKMKLQLCIQEWDQCLEVAQRALSLDPSCLEALRFQILEILCREGRYEEVSSLSFQKINLKNNVYSKNCL